MNYISSFGCLLLILLALTKCEGPVASSSGVQNDLVLSSTNLQPYADLSDLFHVDVISVKSEDVVKIAGTVREFFYTDDRLILFSRIPAIISCVSKEGELLWQLKGGQEGPEYFTNINVVKVKGGKIIVYDDFKQAFFTYNIDGIFEGREYFSLNFNDYFQLNDNCTVFDISEFRAELENGFNQKLKLVTLCDTSMEVSSIVPHLSFQSDKIAFEDFKNFTVSEKDILYRSDFSDTIYRLEQDGTLDFLFSCSFDQNVGTQQVLNDHSVKEKYGYVLQENIPSIDYISLKNGYFLSLYSKNYDNYFTAVNLASGKQFVNTNRIVCDGVAAPAPRDYREGVFLTQMYDHEYRFYQKLRANAFEASPAMLEELETDRNAYGDLDGLVYVLLSFED